MAKYEKKMMQFEAYQYTGDLSVPACDKDFDETKHAPEWVAMAVLKGILFFEAPEEGAKKELYTRYPDGEVVHIPVGYYIIRWSDTELYPCEPDLFKVSYIPVTEESEERHNMTWRFVLWEKAKQEFEDATKPLHEWLCKYGSPYSAVIVKQCGAQAFEGAISFELPVPNLQ